MKVNAYKCDSIDCGRIFEEKESVVIGNKSYDLCPSCIKRLQLFIDSRFKDSSALKEDIETQIKDGVSKTMKKVNKHSRDMSASARLREYGIENIRREYVEENLSIDGLAVKLGVSRSNMAYFLHTNGIKKYNKQSLAEDSKDSEV